MDSQNQDKAFFASFSKVLGSLFVIFFICIIAANLIIPEKAPDPAALVAVEQRIAPVGQVITDPAALMKIAAANKTERAPYSADEVLVKVCNACHLAGVLGAPKEGDKAAWSARLKTEGGVDGLVSWAIKGKNSMPPRGGDNSLSDEEVKSAVAAMLKQAGV